MLTREGTRRTPQPTPRRWRSPAPTTQPPSRRVGGGDQVNEISSPKAGSNQPKEKAKKVTLRDKDDKVIPDMDGGTDPEDDNVGGRVQC